MPEEKNQMMYLWRVFQTKPAPEVLKEAIEMLTRYSGNHQQGDLQWYRTITFADGEVRRIENDQDFFFHYGKPDIAAHIQASLPSGTRLEVDYSLPMGRETTTVRVTLPSREQIDNILKLFSIAEEQRNTRIDPVGVASCKGSLPSRDLVLSRTLVKGTRGYIEIVVNQINGTYEHGWYDACAVMIRRLIETLIIEAFEHHNIASKIKTAAGDFPYLSDLITYTLNETSWNLSRNARQALPKLKNIGDLSAHSRRYNAHHDDIDRIIDSLRVCVQELLYLAALT